jgi:hypothetical protein
LRGLARHRSYKIVEREIGFLLFEDEVHVRVLEEHFLSFFGKLLKLLVHVFDSVEPVLVFGELGDCLKFMVVGKSGKELFIIGLELKWIRFS